MRRSRIKEVGVRELAREASSLIRDAERGERLIVTRHGDPVAVIFSIDQAVEFLISYGEEYAKARLEASGGRW